MDRQKINIAHTSYLAGNFQEITKNKALHEWRKNYYVFQWQLFKGQYLITMRWSTITLMHFANGLPTEKKKKVS